MPHCPECGEDLNPSRKSAYKHAVACMHIPDRGVEQTVNAFRGQETEHAKRVLELMDMERGGEH